MSVESTETPPPLIIDFAALASKDPDFESILSQSPKRRLDFHDPQTLQQLTKTTLKVNFDLKLDLPDDRLCPPVPVRFEYIRWLQRLLDTTQKSYTDEFDPNRVVRGIDIGVGASCIYPLLGCSSRSTWRFLGTDIDGKNLECASRNVRLNGLEDRVTLHNSDPHAEIIPLDRLSKEPVDFVMCNPPFYTSKADMAESLAAKHARPSAVCTGSDIEMITDGGDLGFVQRIFKESLRLRGRVRWYSSMFGKLSSTRTLLADLKSNGISNYAVTRFHMGNTSRWAVAWSFHPLRPLADTARLDAFDKSLLPFPSELEVSHLLSDQVRIKAALDDIFEPLDLKWDMDDDRSSGICIARKNVWSRAARREKARNMDTSTADTNDASDPFVVRLTVLSERVTIRWLQGLDALLFESFHGMLKRQLRERCAPNERHA